MTRKLKDKLASKKGVSKDLIVNIFTIFIVVILILMILIPSIEKDNQLLKQTRTNELEMQTKFDITN